MTERATAAPALGVFVHTLGCKVNQVESEGIAADLLGTGVRLVPEDEAAVVVVNTCTVTGEADAKARKAVRHALRSPAAPVVVVTGCLAAIDPAGLEALGERVVVVCDKRDVASAVCSRLQIPAGDPTADRTRAASRDRMGAAFHTRALVKIEDGCDSGCTYCIVPSARGVPRPVPLSAIATEVEQLVASGTREVVLTGINLGRYDYQGSDLADVVATVAATGIARIRLSSVEPRDLTERLLEMLAATPQVCPHLHVPLQSGDDDVLAAMGRGYTTAEYAARLAAARNALPGLAISTDVIAGFPGETDTQADRTAAFCEAHGFVRLHVFRFSARAGTPAATMPSQVPPARRSARAAALRELDVELRRAHARSRVGAVASVLVEKVGLRESGTEGSRAEAVSAEGTTEDYLKVRFDMPAAHVGEIHGVKIVELRDGFVRGIPTEE